MMPQQQGSPFMSFYPGPIAPWYTKSKWVFWGCFFTLIYSWPIAYKEWCPRSWHWPVLSQLLHGTPVARNVLDVVLSLANRFMVHQKQRIKQGIFFTLTYPWPIAHMDWCPTCWHWLVLSQSLHGAPGAVKMPQPCLLCSVLGECTLLHHLCQFFSCWRGFCVWFKNHIQQSFSVLHIAHGRS